jgi:outer membrane lipoprotein-sorting protein
VKWDLLLVVLAGSAITYPGRTSPADDILARVRNRADGRDIYSDTKLILTDDKGNKRERALIYLQKDYGQDERMTLYFTHPGDIRGVAFQSVNYDESSHKEDDQWIYLPAFRQVRRIASADKRGSFMGSEYAYVDLDRLRVTDYSQTLEGEASVLSRPCYVIARIPVSEKVVRKTGYHKTRLWIDKETSIVLKQTYYDDKGMLFKEMNVRRMEQIDSIWTVMESDMRDHITHKSSTLIFSNVRYNVGLSDALFKQEVLKQGVHVGNLPRLR